MSKSHQIIISGGGTGGHIFPAIAIANALKELEPGIDILFVGAEGKMEMEKVPQAGYPIIGLPVAGLQRRLTLSNIAFPFKLLKSLSKASEILNSFRPDACVGVGGYASGPILMKAASKGIPYLIQEQNSYAGLTNKWLAKKASKICTAYEGMSQFFPEEKILLTGNPVRKDILQLEGKREQALSHFKLSGGKPVLLIIGGSLGARTINHAMLQGLKMLAESGVSVLWQTGKYYYNDIKSAVAPYEASGIKAVDFIREMDLAYAAADVVISRAGALSISELCLVKKPAILVPSPNVTEDHQTKNARALSDKGAALLVKDADASAQLVTTAIQVLKDTTQQQVLSQRIATLAKPDAAHDIARQVLALCK
ncbi:MAG: undecaprenyldiphospho-muramoylpentapeptide beta-N-acetylglucosaminyltransferase [Cytophagaceae bacterium]|jgi:UDP-N-acetylglucosamine--N-acetylmuramyl-(pentapeptide) pyrophosphoryl-undecaprenol N-acetylglucosamine transferase|nr:undecaprenyldiphospho-muramoylpentapeptide beta-N-acetylglucosaminyltransferase [Cytophagaceae bacterium]